MVLRASGDAPQGLQVSIHDGGGNGALLHASSRYIVGKSKGEARAIVDTPACRIIREVIWSGWAPLDTCACGIIGEASRVGGCGWEAEMDTPSTVGLTIEVGVRGTNRDAPHGGVVRVGIVGAGGIGDDRALANTLPR